MTQLEKIHKMPIDEMTNNLVRILTCKRCFCQDICKTLRERNGADGKAPCAVAIKMFLESEVTDGAKGRKRIKSGAKISG